MSNQTDCICKPSRFTFSNEKPYILTFPHYGRTIEELESVIKGLLHDQIIRRVTYGPTFLTVSYSLVLKQGTCICAMELDEPPPQEIFWDSADDADLVPDYPF